MSEVKLIAPPGYGPVMPLDKAKHAGMGLKPDRGYAWCGQLNAVYLSAVEFGRAALDYPIAFTRDAKSDDLIPIAVLGLQQNQNLFVDGDGRWRTHAYIPAYFRRHPFCIAEIPGNGGQEPQRMVCVQEDQLAPSAKPLFDDKGEPTAEWQPIQKLLETVEGTRAQTAAFVKHLDSLGLFAAFDAVALPKQGPQMRLQGMFRVDEDKLRKTPGRELRGLINKGELRAVYAHLLSLENFARLLDLAQSQQERHGN